MKSRESFEASATQHWSRQALLCALFLAVQGTVGYLAVLAARTVASAGPPSTVPPAILLSGLATAVLALFLIARTAARPWRAVPDSVDRILLHHEDSPLRDRIRVSQWILLDSAQMRTEFHERGVNARIAAGVLGVSALACAAVGAIAAVFFLAPGVVFFVVGQNPDIPFYPFLLVFLLGTMVTIVMTSRTAKAELRLAQHYGRQVIAFDDAFGHFLPSAERHRVEALLAVGGSAATADAA